MSLPSAWLPGVVIALAKNSSAFRTMPKLGERPVLKSLPSNIHIKLLQHPDNGTPGYGSPNDSSLCARREEAHTDDRSYTLDLGSGSTPRVAAPQRRRGIRGFPRELKSLIQVGATLEEESTGRELLKSSCCQCLKSSVGVATKRLWFGGPEKKERSSHREQRLRSVLLSQGFFGSSTHWPGWSLAWSAVPVLWQSRNHSSGQVRDRRMCAVLRIYK